MLNKCPVSSYDQVCQVFKKELGETPDKVCIIVFCFGQFVCKIYPSKFPLKIRFDVFLVHTDFSMRLNPQSIFYRGTILAQLIKPSH
jgi:hypothetical protein